MNRAADYRFQQHGTLVFMAHVMDQHTEGTMDTREIIKNKLRQNFDGKIVRKDLTKKIKEGANVPTYVLEFLLGQYCSSDDDEIVAQGVENVKRILADNYVRPDESEKVLSKLRQRGAMTIIDQVTVELNLRYDYYEACFSNLGLGGVPISEEYPEKYDRLLCGGIWCIIQLEYNSDFLDEEASQIGFTGKPKSKSKNGGNSLISIRKLTPIQMPHVDIEDLKQGRKSFTHIFQRGKIADLVNLLSGRNFETRENLESIAEDSFRKLREGVEAFVNETNFKRYLMIVQSTGIVDSSLVRSKNVLNFGYILYLSLKDRGMHPAMIESIVRRWIVLSMLTGRYSGSAESAIDYDIKRFTEQDPEAFLKTTETGELSDAFWKTVLVQRLDTSVASSPYFLVFLMAQVKKNARGFLSKQITVQSLIEQRGDIHHIFPKKYLQKNGVDARKDYNQIANYVYTQFKIKDDAPCEYMARMKQQVAGEGTYYGGITDMDDLRANLAENCVPEAFMDMDIFDYQVFLDTRRTMMAQYIREYYESLA